jgi:tRNA nucleotidyltransferase (CCA-adding enzyme)
MYSILPEKLHTLASVCQFPLYVVGGTCRDFLAGLVGGGDDLDICAPVSVDEFSRAAKQAGWKVVGVYKNTGAVKIACDDVQAEFTCFRTDEYVRGEHNPAKIYFTDDIQKDARRRDFKCNAVYYYIAKRQFVDPLGGIEDIKNKRITTVAPAKKVFGEDGLRLMRLCRQAAQTGFEPTEDCIEGARSNAQLICDISAERIWTELNSLLHADEKFGIQYGQYHGLQLLKKIDVLRYILPDLAEGDGMAQRADYHSHDVLEHTFRCVKYADGNVRLAALLHDVGKPVCMKESGKFIGHEVRGGEIADKICKRLRVNKAFAKHTIKLITMHMYDLDCKAREGKVRRFMVKNYDVLFDLLLLKQADFSACKDNLSKAPCVEKWENLYKQMRAEGVPFTLKELAVHGDDLIAAGVSPEKVGATLEVLLDECALSGRLNDHQRLLSRALAINGLC